VLTGLPASGRGDRPPGSGDSALRVAIVLGAFPVLSETFILDQVTGLIDRGHSVDLFAFTRGDLATVHEDVRRYRLLDRVAYPPPRSSTPARRAVRGAQLAAANVFREPTAVLRALDPRRRRAGSGTLSALRTAAPFFGREAYDVVHCHFGPIGVRALSLREMGVLRGRLVTTFYGFDVSRHVRRAGRDVYRELFRESDLVLAVSEHMRERLVELGCDPGKGVVHRIGVNCDRFTFRERAGGGGAARIASVSRLVEKKGLEFAIRAVGRLVERGLAVRYRIAGDGELRQPLARLVSELGLGGHVAFLGALTHESVVEVLDETDVFLAPSTVSAQGDEEGVPTAIMEAMAMGIPVVSTFHSGIPELVEDGVSGLLAKERDVAGLAEKLGYLATHPGCWPAMGRAGRAQVERGFDIARLNDRLVELYRGLADAAR
jgi:colanic acid/amylovoran biosynthesis glycosyltransferase